MLSAMISLIYILGKNPWGEQNNQLILMELKILYGPLKNDMGMKTLSFLKVVSGNCGQTAARHMITGH